MSIAVALSLAPLMRSPRIRASMHVRPHLPVVVIPYPRLAWPLEISGSQYTPVGVGRYRGLERGRSAAGVQGVSHQLQADSGATTTSRRSKALGISLRDPCRARQSLDISDGAKARAFFEQHFLPLRISRLGEGEGFVTGYYEPVIDGSRTQTDVYTVPVYRRPSNLFVRGFKQSAAGLPNKGEVFRKIGRRKLVPYYDRAEIEDGAIAGRGASKSAG